MDDKAGLDLAIEQGSHRVTRDEHLRTMRAKADALTRVPFADLVPGESYVETDGDQYKHWFLVVRTTRTQAVILRGGQVEDRLRAGSYETSKPYAHLTREVLLVAPLHHAAIVEEAVRRGLASEVPPRARRETPHLFAQVPLLEEDPVRQGDRHPLSLAALSREAHRKYQDTSRFARLVGPATPELVREWIEAAHKQVRVLNEERTRASVTTPDMVASYDQYILEYGSDIMVYRWLLPHLEPGGVFHMDPADVKKSWF